MHRVHEACQSCQYSPGYQDASNPNASSNLVQQKVAGNFEEEIPKKEDSGRESKLLAGNGQFLVHRQSRKADVDAVNERDDVEKEEKRKKSDLQFSNRSPFD